MLAKYYPLGFIFIDSRIGSSPNLKLWTTWCRREFNITSTLFNDCKYYSSQTLVH